jgi:multidrug resistance protein MdtO
MGGVAQSLSGSNGRLAWLWELLRNEMAPYPGRGALVARMVTASTLAMIITMTFRIPYGAYCAILAFTLSRESLEGTANAARTLVIGVLLAGAYAMVGAMLVLGDPMLRLLWVVGTLFLIFYLMSATNNYAGTTRFGYLVVITIPLWDLHITANLKVEGTLWAVGALTIGSVTALLLELVFAAFRPTDDLIEGIAQRLAAVEGLLADYANNRAVEASTQTALTRLTMVGTSRLRRILQRSSNGPQHTQQMGAVVALAGRLVDIAANLTQFTSQVPEEDRQQICRVVKGIAAIRAGLRSGTVPRLTDFSGEGEAPPRLPLVREIEKTVSLIPEVFSGSGSPTMYTWSPTDKSPRTMPLVRGSLSDPGHLKFGLRGCLAASLCYVAYNALFWPEISTAVTTCLLTALSTVGSSHQKQVLRFAGAIVGGVVIGMGAQIFILPYIDSIGAFTVLFAAVATLAAWFATSSARLSYFGAQILVAFCLINLEEFKIQTSLAVARDRVVGILLGLFAMWLFFDQLWSTPAGVEMKRAFISTLRLLAQFAREPVSKDTQLVIERTSALRETINAQFDKVRSIADGVLFEFGASREQDLVLRSRIRQWQPKLRALFVIRIVLRKYRLQLPGFELPEAVHVAQQEFDDRLARMLDAMAARMENGASEARVNFEGSFQSLKHTVATCCANGSDQLLSVNLQTFLALSHSVEKITTSLQKEIR